MTDVPTASEAVQTGARVAELYESGYLEQSKDSLEVSEYAYERGGVGLLNFLDAGCS